MKKIRILLLFIPIFLYPSQQTTLDLLIQNKIYEKNEWKALLHYSNGLSIENSQYILSKNFSLQAEMEADIKAFYLKSDNFKNINNHPQCKFPARFLFIKHELELSKDEFPKILCPEFNKYKNKAPADKIGLTYVSENVKNPSSMMGHTFFKLSGKNTKEKEVTHAVTFYTIIDTYNLITLAYQNLYSGMNGKFVLQPYKWAINSYLHKENRNVWEYDLKVDDYRKKLLYYHLWELKDIDMKYYFTSYNCSTVVYYSLSLLRPKIYDDKKLWITPLDTVKYLYKYNLIEDSNLIASDQWLIKMIEDNISYAEIENIENIIKNHSYDGINKLNFYSLELLTAYNNIEYSKKNINITEFRKIKKRVIESRTHIYNNFDVSKYKTPSKIPPERQVEVGYANVNNIDYTKLSFLPASHFLNDNNKEYFGESELKIAYLSILVNKSDIELNQFTLYSMKSYIPYETLTKDLSYQFKLGVQKEYDKEMNYRDTVKIDGGVGIDFLIAKDINVFSMFNAGIGYNSQDNTHIFFNPEIGLTIYEVFNMKSLVYYQTLFITNDKVYDKYVVEHNIFLENKWKLSINIESVEGDKNYVNYSFSVNKLF